MSGPAPAPAPSSCFGPCVDCGEEHRLPEGDARAHAHEVMREFDAIRRLDYRVPADEADPLLSFDHLFPGQHGNMFGVLECRDSRGETVVLRAFSSLRRGIRDIDGWVQPILDSETYYGLILPEQQAIEKLSDALTALDAGSEPHARVLARRKRRSQELLEEMRSRYLFRNFRGEVRGLREASAHPGGLPGGVGECCAPKLLQHAAIHGLTPVGLIEFYWGGTRGSRHMKHGQFYPCCETRCQPILGFMLCGLSL